MILFDTDLREHYSQLKILFFKPKEVHAKPLVDTET